MAGRLHAAPPLVIQERLPGAAELALARAGGLVLYLRHGLTDNSRTDQAGIADFSDCSQQRDLSPEGRRQADLLGQAIRGAGWPVRRVLSSPMCRALDTARRVFRIPVETDPLLAYTAHMTAVQRRAAVARTGEWLTQAVPPGTLRAVVAHGPQPLGPDRLFPGRGLDSALQALARRAP